MSAYTNEITATSSSSSGIFIGVLEQPIAEVSVTPEERRIVAVTEDTTVCSQLEVDIDIAEDEDEDKERDAEIAELEKKFPLSPHISRSKPYFTSNIYYCNVFI